MAETIPVRFDILLAYAEKHGLDFNELCRTVRDAIAEGSQASARPVAAEVLRLAHVALRESEGAPLVQDWQDAALRVCRAVVGSDEQNPPIFVANGGDFCDVDALAQEIRRVDGKHDLGAGRLAEALMPFLTRVANGGSEGGEG